MVPFEMRPEGGLEAVGGQDNCFELSWPHRSTITKIIIVQVEGGAPSDFEATFYNHASVCQGDSLSDSEGAYQGALPPEIYEVTETLEGSGGVLRYFSSSGGGYTFFSQDNRNASPPRSRPGSTLYLNIRPASPGTYRYAVALGGEVCE